MLSVSQMIVVFVALFWSLLLILHVSGSPLSFPRCDAVVKANCPPFTVVGEELLEQPTMREVADEICRDPDTILNRVNQLACVRDTITNNSSPGMACEDDFSQAYARTFLQDSSWITQTIVNYCNDKDSNLNYVACVNASKASLDNCSAPGISVATSLLQQHLTDPQPTDFRTEKYLCMYARAFFDCYTPEVITEGNCTDRDHDFYKESIHMIHGSECYIYLNTTKRPSPSVSAICLLVIVYSFVLQRFVF